MDIATKTTADLYQMAVETASSAQNKAATSDMSDQAQSSGFGEAMADFAKGLVDGSQDIEAHAGKMLQGSADPHSLVQALAETELALETVVAVRNKVVEAYQEILRMPI